MTDTKRIVWHSDESFADDKGYFVAVITEGESGYVRRPESYAELTHAQDVAKAHNERFGYTSDEVMDVRVSSMSQHNIEKYGEPEADPRHVHYTDEPVEEITVQQAQLIEAATVFQGVIEEVIPSRVSHWLIESLRNDLRDLLNPEHRGYAGKITTKDAMF